MEGVETFHCKIEYNYFIQINDKLFWLPVKNQDNSVRIADLKLSKVADVSTKI